MAWADDYDAPGYDIFAASVLNELVGAFNERDAMLAWVATFYISNPLSTVAVGTDVQARSFWATLQSRVEGLSYHFINWVGASPDGAALSTLTTVEFPTDILGQSWTRKRPREIDDTLSPHLATLPGSAHWTPADGMLARHTVNGQTYVYAAGSWSPSANPFGALPDVITTEGPIEIGDYIGGWLHEDLKACMKACRAVVRDGYPSVATEYVDNIRRIGEALYQTTLSGAKSAAAATYASSGQTSLGFSTNQMLRLTSFQETPLFGGTFDARYEKLATGFRASSSYPTTPPPSAIGLALYTSRADPATNSTQTFELDTYGLTLGAPGTIALTATVGSSPVNFVELLDDIDSASLPNAPADPSSPVARTIRGFSCQAWFLMRFDVTGGFTYQ